MKRNHQKEERQNTQSKKTKINDKITNEKGHQQERWPNAPKNLTTRYDEDKKTYFPLFFGSPAALQKILRIFFQVFCGFPLCWRKTNRKEKTGKLTKKRKQCFGCGWGKSGFCQKMFCLKHCKTRFVFGRRKNGISVNTICLGKLSFFAFYKSIKH